MRFFFLSVPGLLALLSVLWCAHVLQSLADDIIAYRETQSRAVKALQMLKWAGTLVAAVVAGVIFYSLFTQSISEWESWKRY